VLYQQGNLPAARKFIEEGLAISRQLDDKYGSAIALTILGDLTRAEGTDDMAARPLFEEALALFREIGNKQSVSDNLNSLGAVACEEGDFAAARTHFAEGLATARELGDKTTISYSLDGFAALYAENGDIERAANLAGAADRMRESIGYEIEPAERRFRDAYLTKLRAAMSEEGFAAAWERGRKLKTDEILAVTEFLRP
jgi:tetratricopeptide (TPR) repeat protein